MKMIRRRKQPRTVPQLARAIGVARQRLQETVRDHVGSGLLNFEPTVFDRRAPIVVLTHHGEACLEQHWVADLTRGLDERVAQTEWVVRCLRERLRDSLPGEVYWSSGPSRGDEGDSRH